MRGAHCFVMNYAIAIILSLLPVLAACSVKDKPAVTVKPQVVPGKLWIAPSGLDDNPGTRAAPLRTLARAARIVEPGTVVNVLPGTYHGGFRTDVDGLPNARIVFRATERGRARIVPPPQSKSDIAWDNRASWIDIDGFEIDGSPPGAGSRWRIGIYSGGSHNRIAANRVHHIALDVPCTSKGGSAIGVDSYYRGKHTDVIGNVVHDIGPPGCRWVQGIYVNTPATVRDNIVYRVAEAGIHMWHDAHDVVVVNNTVVACNTGILVGGGDFYYTKGPNDRTRVLNNIVYDNRYGISEQGATGRHNIYSHNLVFGNTKGDWRLAPGMTHSRTVAAPPGFVGYSRSGTPDLRLTTGSPARGRAQVAGDGKRGTAGASGNLGASIPQRSIR
jgi:hypothetical protein